MFIAMKLHADFVNKMFALSAVSNGTKSDFKSG